MKGIVFNLLEQTVSDKYGEDTWDALLEGAGLEGSYTAVGSYPDEELIALVDTGCTALGVEQDDLIRWFGRAALPLLAAKYPGFFSPYDSTRAFLMTLNEIIHPEVRKLFPGAYAPSFEFDTTNENDLGLAYHSHRNLCSFAEGLIEGSADHFGEAVDITQATCSKRGDQLCDLHIHFTKL
ncbi:MAG: heme NO-binding domain-containing protein [Actinomycetota bacterium]